MNWLREMASDSRTNKLSSKRGIALLTAFVLAISTLILCVATLFGHSVTNELTVVVVPLAILAGVTYVGGKAVEKARGENS